MKLILFILTAALILASCSSKKDKFLADITALQLTSDSVASQLSTINAENASEWFESYLSVKYQLILVTQKDTIPQNLSESLDNYLTNLSAMEHLEEDLGTVKSANDSQKIRLKHLRSDIENQRGERAQFENFLKQEKLEAASIKNDAGKLTKNYSEAENAHTQFLPEIERFIRTFVRE